MVCSCGLYCVGRGRATDVGSEPAFAGGMRFASREKSHPEVGGGLAPGGGPTAGIASPDRRGRAQLYGYINRALRNAESAPECGAFHGSLDRPASQMKIKALIERGFHKAGDVENGRATMSNRSAAEPGWRSDRAAVSFRR